MLFMSKQLIMSGAKRVTAILLATCMAFGVLGTSLHLNARAETAQAEVFDLSMTVFPVTPPQPYTGQPVTIDRYLALASSQGKYLLLDHINVTYSKNINAGNATVFLMPKAGDPTYTGSASFTFVIVPIDQKSFSIDGGNRTVFMGGRPFALPLLNAQADATQTWNSSRPGVAQVSENGTVTITGTGTTVISVADSGTQNYNPATASITLTVVQPVTSLKLNRSSAILKKGKTLKLTAAIGPANANNKAVKWTSDKKSIAKVDQQGIVTGIKAGRTSIYATTRDGSEIEKKCTVTVKNGVKSVSLNTRSKTLKKGKSFTLKATVKPKNAFSTKVTWHSNKKKVAKVNAKGKVTARKKGTAKITVKTVDNNKKATCTVTVR